MLEAGSRNPVLLLGASSLESAPSQSHRSFSRLRFVVGACRRLLAAALVICTRGSLPLRSSVLLTPTPQVALAETKIQHFVLCSWLYSVFSCDNETLQLVIAYTVQGAGWHAGEGIPTRQQWQPGGKGSRWQQWRPGGEVSQQQQRQQPAGEEECDGSNATRGEGRHQGLAASR